MKKNLVYCILLLSITSCGNHTAKDPSGTVTKPDSIIAFSPDTASSRPLNTDTLPASEQELLIKPIRENFKRINAITRWTSIVKKDLWESTEGGTATFYYSNGNLEKIVVREFGETYQLLTAYYLLKGQLSFTLERNYRYNRPIYYDSTAMKENNDTEAFDMGKATITVIRGYFSNNRLIHASHSDTTPLPPGDLPGKQAELKAGFEKYLRLVAIK